MEGFWGILKSEMYYLRKFSSKEELTKAIEDYIEFYNTKRYQLKLKCMTRKDLLVAVGGGVVGDLGGFCAASYMRGIDFVNCPTTTLSQIDSSIGGKTAIDLGETKNIVGAFWQPKVVLVDFDALATLPRRHFVNGLAEAIKAGLIADPELFALFECEHPEENIERII